jgi:hypothetical protein
MQDVADTILYHEVHEEQNYQLDLMTENTTNLIFPAYTQRIKVLQTARYQSKKHWQHMLPV